MNSVPLPLLRRFGRTGLAYPEIGLGTWTFSDRDFGPIATDAAAAIIERALVLGIRFIDTADVYGWGAVEEIVGATLAGTRAGVDAVVATKVGNDFRKGGPSVKNVDPDYLDEALDRCKRRLGRPVDLIQLHNPPSPALVDGRILEQLARWRHDGRVRMTGLSTIELADIRLICETDAVDALQIPFNILRQELLLAAEEVLAAWGGALIVRTPLEYGLLSGRLPPAEALSSEDWRRRAWPAEEAERKRNATTELANVLSRRGRTLAQAAVQFALLPPQVSVVIPGAHSPDQLEKNVGASRAAAPLTPAQLREIDRIAAAHGLVSDAIRWTKRTGVRVLAIERRAPACNSQQPPAELAPLFSPLALGPVRLANRLIRSGTTERATDSSGRPTSAMAEILSALAAGGAGMTITGFTATSRASRASASHAVLCDIGDLAAWRACVERVRDAAPFAPLCLQIGHGGRLALDPSVAKDAAPIDAFQRTATLAAECGFQAIQIHAAHGYLLSQLLTDAPESGIRLVRDITEAVRSEIGPAMAVLVKANVSDFVHAGLAPQEASYLAEELAGMAVDAIEWSGWVPWACPVDSPSRPGEIDETAEGFFLPFVRRLRSRPLAWPALGCCGGWRTGRAMARALADGLDFVSISRALIAEPDLMRRLRAGQARALCDGCNRCLAKEVRPIHCPVLGERAA